MSFQSPIKCSVCGSDSLKDKSNYGLVSLNKESDGSVSFDLGAYFPVKPYACTSCGHVDLKHNRELKD